MCLEKAIFNLNMAIKRDNFNNLIFNTKKLFLKK